MGDRSSKAEAKCGELKSDGFPLCDPKSFIVTIDSSWKETEAEYSTTVKKNEGKTETTVDLAINRLTGEITLAQTDETKLKAMTYLWRLNLTGTCTKFTQADRKF